MSARGSAALTLALLTAGVGLLLGVLAAVLLPALPLPVTADLRGPGGAASGARVLLPEVAGRIAVLVPVLLTGAALLLTRRSAARLQRLVPVGAAAPIAVFLVAQVNGVRDVGALVLVYAATAASVLIRWAPGRWPWSVAAMLGIVPWGVVALHQVGALLTGGHVPGGVQVVTVVVLVATIAEFVLGGGGLSAVRAAPVPVVLAPALLAAGSLLL